MRVEAKRERELRPPNASGEGGREREQVFLVLFAICQW